MSMASLPRKLKIVCWAAAGICLSASLAAGAEPGAPPATITALAARLPR